VDVELDKDAVSRIMGEFNEVDLSDPHPPKKS
jgi:hypothetical protein